MKNKRGFTLIELLAVIVILAIVALIATPIVLNIINESKISVNIKTVDNYKLAVENSIVDYLLKNPNKEVERISFSSHNKLKINNEFIVSIDYKGKKVDCEKVLYNKDKTIYLSHCKLNDSADYVKDQKNNIYASGVWNPPYVNYTKEQIEADEHIYAIGHSNRLDVVAIFNEDYTSVKILKNGKDSNGKMQSWTPKNSSALTFGSEQYTTNGKTTYYNESDKALFNNVNPFYLYRGRLKNVEIMEGITYIGNYSFVNNNKIESISLPEGLTTVGNYAFYDAIALKTIEFPSTLTDINMYAFTTKSAGTSNLTGPLKFPKSLVNIGYASFYNCSKLTGISFEEDSKLKRIEGFAFCGCSSLAGSLIFPENLEYIGISTFSGCTSLTGTLKLPKSLTSIDNYAFYGCKGLTGTLNFGKNLKTIGEYAFNNCEKLTGVTFEEDCPLEKISNYAFNGCKGLKGTLKIPNKVKYIGIVAFQRCSNLTGLELNEGLLWIGDFAFNHLARLKNTKIIIPSTVQQIGGRKYIKSNDVYGSHTFYDIGGVKEFEVASGNTSYKTIDGALFTKDETRLIAYPPKKSGDTYTLPEGLTNINEKALNRAWYLKTLVLPNSYIIKKYSELGLNSNYEKLNETTFNNLSTAIYMFNSLENIDVKSDNTNYKSVNGMLLSKDGTILYYIPLNNSINSTIVIPEGVTTLYQGFLNNTTVDSSCRTNKTCYSASKIIIPSTVKSITTTDISSLNKQNWTIEVASGNTSYKINSSGKLEKIS